MAEGDSRKQRRIYSTKVIDQLIKDRQDGYEIDFEPFFNRDLDLRAANVPFNMTHNELEEYQKCFDDPIYYAETYAKFMTDHGLTTVDLRDYQKNVINTVTEETYDEENDLILPVNRNIVWNSARQSGKCVNPCVSIYYRKNNLSGSQKNNIFKIEDKYIKKSLLKRIKNFLYKIYNII